MICTKGPSLRNWILDINQFGLKAPSRLSQCSLKKFSMFSTGCTHTYRLGSFYMLTGGLCLCASHVCVSVYLTNATPNRKMKTDWRLIDCHGPYFLFITFLLLFLKHLHVHNIDGKQQAQIRILISKWIRKYFMGKFTFANLHHVPFF